MNWLTAVLVVLALFAFIWQVRAVSKYAMEPLVVTGRTRGTLEVLVHRQGIYLMTRGDQFWGAFTLWPLMFSVLWNRGREWRWAVTVREVSLGVGVEPPMYHEVCGSHDAAEKRSVELIGGIRGGDEHWLPAAE